MDVNRLLKQYEMVQQLTKQMTKGRMPSIPGMGGLGGLMGHGRSKKKRRK